MAEPVSKKIVYYVKGKEVGEPLIYTIGKKFDVVTNIQGASIADGIGFVALELTGQQPEIDKAIHFLEERHVRIETLE